jgi:hypothetical protein
MTRRELKDAVVEAARPLVNHVTRYQLAAAEDAFRALDACTEPDLDALNAAVAEAAESMVLRWESEGFHNLPSSPENTVRLAILARRAAMQPKPRYEVNLLGVYDHKNLRFLQPEEIAALLNKEKP